MHPPGALQVYHGFEQGLRASQAMLLRALRVSSMTPGPILDEFGPGLADVYGRITQQGGSVRQLVLGPFDPGVARELAARGVEVRSLDEAREVGLVVTQDAVLLFPTGQDAGSPLTNCTILVEDIVAVAHFELAFDRAWERARAFRP